MDLQKHQEELLSVLKQAVKRNGKNAIVYKSEWLGYLPFGQYHWVEVGGEEINAPNSDSLHEDLSTLSQQGKLKIIKETQINNEDLHIYYELEVS